MIRDCEADKIDFILTKSISRFARNTQDSLKYTRELKEMGIGIYFEKEGLNTLESSGELLLTLFSCFARKNPGASAKIPHGESAASSNRGFLI